MGAGEAAEPIEAVVDVPNPEREGEGNEQKKERHH